MKAVFWTLAFVVYVSGAPAATIRVEPASAAALTGGTVDVSIQVIDAADLYAYQFDVAFDPAVVSAVSVTEGRFLAVRASTLFLPGTIDNTAGTVALTANTLIGAGPGVSGTGALAVFRFTGVGLGTTSVSLSNVVLLNSALGDIDATIQTGSVTVAGRDSVVPEPSSAMLAAIGIGAAAVIARRRSA